MVFMMKMNPHIRDLNEVPVEPSAIKQADITSSTRYELTQYSHRELIELVLAKDILIKELKSGVFKDEYFGESKEVASLKAFNKPYMLVRDNRSGKERVISQKQHEENLDGLGRRRRHYLTLDYVILAKAVFRHN